VLLAPQVLVDLRRGRNDAVVAAVDAHLDGVAAGEASDPVRDHFALLRAFAAERAGRPLPEEAVTRVVGARLASPGRALPLEKWWPELDAFVTRHAPPHTPSTRPSGA